jgi:hypothetical protein
VSTYVEARILTTDTKIVHNATKSSRLRSDMRPPDPEYLLLTHTTAR